MFYNKIKNLNSKKAILSYAKNTILDQSFAISKIADLIDQSFSDAVELIYNSNGRVIITGIGKSAIIANKIVATLNSTGTPSVFMHAADAIHGDLGLVLKNDVVICISKSGNTPEIKVLIPLLKKAKNPLIAITGNIKSVLAEQADFVFNSFVKIFIHSKNSNGDISNFLRVYLSEYFLEKSCIYLKPTFKYNYWIKT